MPTTYQQKIDFIASLSFDAKSVKDIEGALGSAFTDSVKKAAAMGGSRITKAFVAGAAKVAKEMEVVADKIVQAETDAANAKDEAIKKQYADEARRLKRELQQKKRAVDLEEKAHEKYIDRQAEMLKAYDNLVVNMKVDKSQLAKDMGEALSAGFGKLSSGDLSGLVGSLSGALSKGGGMMEAAGLAAGGAEAGGLAAAAASLGPIVVGLGAAVGVLAGVAAVFQMAYDQTKKYNQALTEGTGAADFFSTGVGNMAVSLGELRGAVFDLGTRFRMDTEEIAKFTNALNTAGITYKEFAGLAGGGKTAQESFFDVTKTAIIAAKGLGIEAGDAAAFMDKSMRDLGKTTLPEIQNAFGMIGDAAARSGMTVKSFFTAINEATSGMALHNIRLEDTIGLMLTMTKVLGEDLAKERAKMEGQFKNMGYQERIKTVMTTGVGTTSKIVRADAEAQARAMGKPLRDVIKGVREDLVTESGISVDKLGSMTEKEYRKVVGALYASNDQNAHVAARQLDNMRDLARGAVRPGDELAQADAIGQLSKSGELAMQLASASAVLGEKGISSMTGLTRAAFEQITGQSGENFEIMKRLDRALRSQFEGLQQKVAAGGGTEEEKRFAKMDFTQAVAAGFGKATMEEGVRAGFTGMERMTEQMLTETQSFTTVLKNQVAFVLEKIYTLLEWVVRYLGGDKQAKALEEQSKQMQALEANNAKSAETATAINDLIRKQASMGLSAEEKAELAVKQGEYADLQKEGKSLRAGLGAFSTYQSPEAAMAMSKVEGAAAAVGAGGGREAYQAELAAREAARQQAGGADVFGFSPTDDYWSLVGAGALAGGVAGAAGGTVFGGIGALPGAALGTLGGAGSAALAAWLNTPDEQTTAEIQQGLDSEGVTTGLERLAENTGLTSEYTSEAQATLADMLSGQERWFEKGGKPLAALNAEQKDLLDKLLQQMRDTSQSDALNDLAASSEEGRAAVAAFLTSGDKASLDIPAFTESQDPKVMQAYRTLRSTTSADDFIYRGGAQGGVITPINSADQFIGMKPGGSVERAGRGAGNTIIININGDTATIVRTVKEVLQKAGLTASPTNGYA